MTFFMRIEGPSIKVTNKCHIFVYRVFCRHQLWVPHTFLYVKKTLWYHIQCYCHLKSLGGGSRYSVFWNFGRGNYFHLLKVAYMAGAEKSTGRGSEKRLEFWQKIVCPLKKNSRYAYGLWLLLDLCSACRKSQMRMYLPDWFLFHPLFYWMQPIWKGLFLFHICSFLVLVKLLLVCQVC